MYFGIAIVFVSTYVYMCCAAASVSHDIDPSTITCLKLCEHIKFTTWTSCENSTRFRYNYICCKNMTRTDCERRCNVSLSLTKAEKISKPCTANLTTDSSSTTTYGSTSLSFLMTSTEIGSESKTTPIIVTPSHETTSSLETTTMSEVSSVSISTTNRGNGGYTEQSSTMSTREDMKTISPASTMDMPASTDKFTTMASSTQQIKLSTATSSLNHTENSSQHSRLQQDGDSSSTTRYDSTSLRFLMTSTQIGSESETTPIISTRHETTSSFQTTTMSEVSSESISTTNRTNEGYTEQSSTMSTREDMTTISPVSTTDMHASTDKFTTMSSSKQQDEVSTASSNLNHTEKSSHHSRTEQIGEQQKKTSTVAIAVGCSLGGVVILAIMIASVLIWKRISHGSQISPTKEEEPTELIIENNPPDRSVHFEERAD